MELRRVGLYSGITSRPASTFAVGAGLRRPVRNPRAEAAADESKLSLTVLVAVTPFANSSRWLDVSNEGASEAVDMLAACALG